MMSRGRWSVIALLAATLASSVGADEPEHLPLFCGLSVRCDECQRDLKGLCELPAEVEASVSREIHQRLGVDASNLTFRLGQIKNLDAPSTPDETVHPLGRRLYNLNYEYAISAEQSINACILVEPDGHVVQPLSLPAWAKGAPPPLVTEAEATEIARDRGFADSRDVELRYFPDTDRLEWLVTKVTVDQGVRLSGETLHVPMDDPTAIHWTPWEAIR